MPRAEADANGGPIRIVPTAGRNGDHAGARTLVNQLPDGVMRLVADRGHDAYLFRKASKER